MTHGQAPQRENLQSRIQQLEDRVEIRELAARYAFAVTRGRCPETADLYTEDGSFEVRGADGTSTQLRVAGQQDLRDFYGRMEPAGTKMIHDLILDLRGDKASGTCVHDSPCYTGEVRSYCGYYEDAYERIGGWWRFKSRVFFFLQGGLSRSGESGAGADRVDAF
jgi:hypothetical protein